MSRNIYSLRQDKFLFFYLSKLRVKKKIFPLQWDRSKCFMTKNHDPWVEKNNSCSLFYQLTERKVMKKIPGLENTDEVFEELDLIKADRSPCSHLVYYSDFFKENIYCFLVTEYLPVSIYKLDYSYCYSIKLIYVCHVFSLFFACLDY